VLRPATAADAAVIAQIHIDSWRSAYRHILASDYLAGPIEQDRHDVWSARFASPNADMQVTIAEDEAGALGFICTFGNDDPVWGAMVDNLHVLPRAKGRGVGRSLLAAAAKWVARRYPGAGLHLWVFEANTPARGFYDRMGGDVVERIVEPIAGGGEAHSLRYAWRNPLLLQASTKGDDPAGS
jgi:ribosomal protein S18 acetylase RimI-like enzyme